MGELSSYGEVLPEQLPRLDSAFDDFRQLALAADYYINGPGSNRQRLDRIKEASDLLNEEAIFFLGRQVRMGGILKKAQLPNRDQPTLQGTRHLERTSVKGTASGVVVYELEKDFEDVRGKSPRQDKLLHEIEARSLGQYGLGYVVDMATNLRRSGDFLHRAQNVRSAMGLVTSSFITLDEFGPQDEGLFGLDDTQENEVLRIIESCPEHLQRVVHYIAEQLLDSDDKIAILANNVSKLKKLARHDNPVELMAIADYFGYIMGDDFINRTYAFEDPLPVALEVTDPDTFTFYRLSPAHGNQVHIGGLAVSPGFKLAPDTLSVSFLDSPDLYLQAYPVVEGYIVAQPILLPLEQLALNKSIETPPPLNITAEGVIDETTYDKELL